MAVKQSKTAEFYTDITPIEFERILKLYGMQKIQYSSLCDKSQSWFYRVFRKKKYISVSDVKFLSDEIGEETFDFLLKEVRGEKWKIENSI